MANGRLSRGYSVWAVIVLALAGMLSAVSRGAPAVLLSPIQHDLHASDQAMGALTGFVFALVYAVAALPMSRFADNGSRRNMVVAAIGLWSVASAAGGLAGNYLQLALTRIGVAGGEAALTPAVFSMVGDLFPREQRGGPLGIYSVGTTIGFSAGAYATGLLAARFGWHGALIAIGLPGLLLALVGWLTVPEPPHGAYDGHAEDVDRSSVWTKLKRLGAIPTALPLLLASICLFLSSATWLAWLPAFLQRIHHLDTAQAGFVVMIVVGVGGALSNIVGGFLSDRMARRGERWRLYFCGLLTAIALPFLVASLLLQGVAAAVVCMCLFTLANGSVFTVSYAATLSIARPRMRAFMIAFFGLVGSVIGGGGGPWVVGALNDTLRSHYGDEAIRFTLMLSPIAIVFASLAFFWASRTIDADAHAASNFADDEALEAVPPAVAVADSLI